MVDDGGEGGGLREIANSKKEWNEIEWKRESARGWIQRGKTCNFRMQEIFMKYLNIFIHSLINLIKCLSTRTQLTVYAGKHTR